MCVTVIILIEKEVMNFGVGDIEGVGGGREGMEMM